MFLFLNSREREREHTGGGEKQKKGENLKQAPIVAQSPKWGLIL